MSELLVYKTKLGGMIKLQLSNPTLYKSKLDSLYFRDNHIHEVFDVVNGHIVICGTLMNPLYLHMNYEEFEEYFESLV